MYDLFEINYLICKMTIILIEGMIFDMDDFSTCIDMDDFSSCIRYAQ